MKRCIKCNSEIIRSSHANNVKYCAGCRKEAYKYLEYRTEWQRQARYQTATTATRGKIKCQYCAGYYKKPISHAWQVHSVNEREYKENAGLDHKKGIITNETREVLREYVKENFALVVKKNLLEAGKKSRFRKGDPGVGEYKRSAQTIERLKKQFKKTK